MKSSIKNTVAGMSRTKKIVLAVTVTGASVMVVGTVAALWSAHGTGNGQSKALTAQTVTVASATATADLYPGYSGGKVSFTLANTNPYAITFTSMTPGTVTSSDQTNCPATNVTASAKTGLTLNVAANATSAPLSIDGVAAMSIAAPNGCQGVTFTIPLTLTGMQDTP